MKRSDILVERRANLSLYIFIDGLPNRVAFSTRHSQLVGNDAPPEPPSLNTRCFQDLQGLSTRFGLGIGVFFPNPTVYSNYYTGDTPHTAHLIFHQVLCFFILSITTSRNKTYRLYYKLYCCLKRNHSASPPHNITLVLLCLKAFSRPLKFC